MKEIIEKHIAEHQAVFGELTHLIPQIEGVASTLVDALKNGKTIFWCGNGGSASDSQHLAGELIGRFVGTRVPLTSISLTAGGAEGSCIANAFCYDQIFSRQV